MSKRDTVTGQGAIPGWLTEDECYYYLHTNGELIHKGRHYSWEAFDESDFVKKWWIINLQRRWDCYNMIFHAIVLGVDPKRVEELRHKWGMTDEDTIQYCLRTRIAWSYDSALGTYTVFGISNSSLFYAISAAMKKAMDDDKFFQQISNNEKVDDLRPGV